MVTEWTIRQWRQLPHSKVEDHKQLAKCDKSWSAGLLSSACARFAKIAKPLSDLVAIPSEKKNTTRNTTNKNSGQTLSNTPIVWTDIHQTAFNALIDIVTQPPILAYPDYDDIMIFFICRC